MKARYLFNLSRNVFSILQHTNVFLIQPWPLMLHQISVQTAPCRVPDSAWELCARLSLYQVSGQSQQSQTSCSNGAHGCLGCTWWRSQEWLPANHCFNFIEVARNIENIFWRFKTNWLNIWRSMENIFWGLRKIGKIFEEAWRIFFENSEQIGKISEGVKKYKWNVARIQDLLLAFSFLFLKKGIASYKTNIGMTKCT